MLSLLFGKTGPYFSGSYNRDDDTVSTHDLGLTCFLLTSNLLLGKSKSSTPATLYLIIDLITIRNSNYLQNSMGIE